MILPDPSGLATGEMPHATMQRRTSFFSEILWENDANLSRQASAVTRSTRQESMEEQRGDENRAHKQTAQKHGCLPDLSSSTVQERLDWSLASIDGGQLGPG